MKERMIKYGLLFAVLIIILNSAYLPSARAEENTVDVIVFVGETCPHCAELENYLENLKQEHDYINPIYYEVWYNPENRALLEQMASEYGFKVNGVPTYFIGDKYFVGYSPRMNQEIIDAISSNHNPGTGNSTGSGEGDENGVINIPIIGEVSPDAISLPVLTVLLGFLDGFNPCAFFVLLFLLSMLVYAKSKKRMLIIGLTFVFFSGLVYFLFMAAWLNFFMITKNITVITTIAGIVALIIAAINIKDFFAFKKGVSLSVSDDHRKSLITRMKSLLKAESMASMMVGTITLAIAANMYELLCTAGFPMVFTKVLVLNELDTVSYYSYLLFYNLVYIIPLLTIVLIFTRSFGAKRLSQSQGEALKLLSGMMMLALGSMLVFAPGLLNNVFAAAGTIALAIMTTGIILLIRKKIKKKEDKENGQT